LGRMGCAHGWCWSACLAAPLQPPPLVEETGRRRCQQLGDHICTASSCRRPWR
jgi:hypothetical protein